MRREITLSVVVAAGLLLAPTASAVTAATAAHPAGNGTVAAASKCRSQTYTYVKGRKPLLNSAHGPYVRTASHGTFTLTDNQVLAQYQPVNNGVPAKYINLTTSTPENSRLESVTVYPTKGKHKTFKIDANANKDFVYKYDLLKDYGQVQLPVSGNDGNGRATPKLKKVVVKARESCFTMQ
jgi:hypothetical protein